MDDSALVSALDELSLLLEKENSATDLFPELDFYGYPLDPTLAPIPVMTSSPLADVLTPSPPRATPVPATPKKPSRSSMACQTTLSFPASTKPKSCRKLFPPKQLMPPLSIRFRGKLKHSSSVIPFRLSPLKGMRPDATTGGYRIYLDAEEIFLKLVECGVGIVTVKQRGSTLGTAAVNEGGEFIVDGPLPRDDPIVIDLDDDSDCGDVLDNTLPAPAPLPKQKEVEFNCEPFIKPTTDE